MKIKCGDIGQAKKSMAELARRRSKYNVGFVGVIRIKRENDRFLVSYCSFEGVRGPGTGMEWRVIFRDGLIVLKRSLILMYIVVYAGMTFAFAVLARMIISSGPYSQTIEMLALMAVFFIFFVWYMELGPVFYTRSFIKKRVVER